MEREGIRQSHFAPPINTVLCFQTFDAEQKRNDSANAALVRRFGLVVLFEVVQASVVLFEVF
jgi:hypothetical protein